MKERHYYSALKTLEQLEHIHLPRVRGYIFSELLAEEIPRMRESIQRQSMSELKVKIEREETVHVHVLVIMILSRVQCRYSMYILK